MSTKKLFSRIGFGYVIFFLVSIIAQSVILIGMEAVSGRWFSEGFNMETVMLMSQVAMYGIALPILSLWMRRLPSWGKEKKDRLSAGHLLLLMIFCFGVTYIGNIIGQILMYLVELVTKTPVSNPVDAMVGDLSPRSLFIFVVIIAPLMEELVFRKLLIDRIISYGQLPAMLVSGIAFGLFHGNFYQFFYACSIGMVFAYIYTRTGTIWYSVFLHAVINFTGGFLASLLLTEIEAGSYLATAGTVALGFLMVITIITSIVLFFVYVTKVKFFPGWKEEQGGALVKKIFLAPGVWAYLVICMVMFFLT